MPNTASAAKQARAALRRRERNLAAKTKLRSVQRQFLALVNAGKKDEAKALHPKVMSALDRAVKTGHMHRNAASHRKSRYTSLVIGRN